MEKKFYFFLSLFLLLGFTSFAQFQEVAQLTDYPNAEHTTGDNLGSSVAIDGAYVVSGAVEHMGIGAVYVFYNNGVTFDTLAVLTPSNGSLGDKFGSSVSIAGDVIVVGAANNDDLGSNSGSAYVFIKPSSGWSDMTETVQLTASGINSSDYFGESVSILGDIVVVGARGQNNTGSVYVYEKPSTGWADVTTETAKLNASDASSSDYFGYSVSISSDVIVVGAYGDDDNGSYSGSAYVFEKPSGSWVTATETAKLTATDGAEYDYFGFSVSISGGLIVVGAKHYLTRTGAAYIFEKPSGSWVTATETAKLTASDGATNDYFGNSVSVSANVVAIGAYGDDDSSTDSGSVYIFEEPSLGWSSMTETTKINPSDADFSNRFGFSVSIVGDYLVSGAVSFDLPWEDSGAAYVFEMPSAGWAPCVEIAKLLPRNHPNKVGLRIGEQVAIDGNIAVVSEGFDGASFVEVLEFDGLNWEKVAVLSPSDGINSDDFGSSVSISGDVIVIGSPENLSWGAAYVFEKPSTGWEDMTETAKLVSSDIASGDYFGGAVGISNDVIVVGAKWDQYDGVQLGSAYVFEKPSGAWVSDIETAKLTATDGAEYDYFGSALSISNNTIVVGAYGDDIIGSNEGSAYIFEKPSGSWVTATETAKLTASDGATNDYFGNSLSVSGNVVAIGAYRDEDNGSMSGSAYVFEKPSSGWITTTETAKLLASNGTSNDYFGFSVSISGDIIVSGAYGEEGTGVYHGAAYVFEKPVSGWVSSTEDQILFASDENQYYNFAKSVAISNNYILSGSADANIDGFDDSGSAYLFQAPLTWTGAIDSDWHTATNWDFGILPRYYDDVYIDYEPMNYPEIVAEADCYDFELGSTASLKIFSDAITSGSIIIGGSYTGAPDMEYHRYMVGDQWHLVGSPFGDYAIGDYIYDANLVNDGTNYSMKDYEEDNDDWSVDYLSSTAGNMELGKGYASKSIANVDVYFKGTPNTAAVNKTLMRDGMGWNLLSNPFTSAIAITDDAVDVDSYLLNTANLAVLDPSYYALYVWVEDTGDPTNIDNYKVINNGATGTLVQDYLQVGQGFFVKTKSGGGSFEITPAMQVHQTTADFKKAETTSWTNIILRAETAEAKVSTKVAYSEQMTRGLDMSYDAGLLKSNSSFSLYSKLLDDNGVDFMVQCLPTSYEDLIIPIGLDADAGSEITFRAEVSNLPEDYVAVLEDRENRTFTAFETEQSVYTITLDEASTGTGRFYLRTSFKSSVGVSDLGQSNFSVFAQSSSQTLIINGRVEENTIANVYDIRGKLVKSFDLQLGTQNRLMFNEQSGVYIIQISNSKGIVSKKVNWVK